MVENDFDRPGASPENASTAHSTARGLDAETAAEQPTAAAVESSVAETPTTESNAGDSSASHPSSERQSAGGSTAAESTNGIISARDLDVYYGDERALRDVSIEIRSERVTAIIGPSGCGKSTFLRCFNRMNDLIQSARVDGRVEFEGTNIYDDDVDPVALRRRIGMVFQQPNPFPKSIFDNVAYGLRTQDDTENLDERVERALKRAALWDEVEGDLDKSALDLSGGQQQRLCTARAIAVDPDIILMDEPASALDPIATSKIEDLIEELAEDYTVVIVTHNMQQAARISDRTAVFLTGGELVEYGDTDQIFENPESDRVEDYITGKFG
ncbi:phosphate ABC transporter ATP-binding protein PstB [Halobellus captivus]|uniref:phosphate ABC transporter ATP-binding protein PstB n=1 Tax=Halobellus captivus TaxID=2592614 RepID=UPI00193AD35C|nr:phosphate ABC transporter ATP-binding protein PstB [Halobellus captivus]